MAADNASNRRLEILEEMQAEFDQVYTNSPGADELRAHFQEIGKYSEDAIEEFVIMMRNSGMIDTNKPDSNRQYVVLSREEGDIADQKALEDYDDNLFAAATTTTQASESKPSESSTSPFTIDAILGGKYPHTADILYEKCLPDSTAETFENSVANITADNLNIETLTQSIVSILAETSSQVFYTGTEATKQIKNLQTAADNSTTMKNHVNTVTSDTVQNVVTSYNNALKAAKKEVRIELLKDTITSLNGTVKYTTDEDWYEDEEKPTGIVGDTRHENGVYKIIHERKLLRTEERREFFSTKTIYVYREYWKTIVDIIPSEDYEKMESDILIAGGQLPYDKSRIVDF